MNCFFYDKIYPLIKTFALNVNLYYCSLFTFAFCLAAGAAKLFMCLISSKARAKSAGGLLAFYIFAFACDAIFCLAECEFCGKYFKSPASAYLYCFVKFGVLTVLYIFVAIVASLLRFSDRKRTAEDEELRSNSFGQNVFYGYNGAIGNFVARGEAFSSAAGGTVGGDDINKYGYMNAPVSSPVGMCGGGYCGVREKTNFAAGGEKKFNASPEENERFFGDFQNAGEKPRSVRILKRLTEENEGRDASALPDINVAYIVSLAERIKNAVKNESEREQIDELLFELKYPSSLDGFTENINEKLNFLIKAAVDNGVDA